MVSFVITALKLVLDDLNITTRADPVSRASMALCLSIRLTRGYPPPRSVLVSTITH
tara:strand:- start:373 stop:540 length:168 start_codon:yes stop_codon:yes gene_type:complete